MRVGILGLAANPVHKGHIELTTVVVDSGEVDVVWLMPCNAHAHGKALIESRHRLAMCRRAVDNLSMFIEVCDWEILNRKSGIAYDTVLGLRKSFPEHEFKWIIGSDNAENINWWFNYEKLIETIPFLVIQRKNVPLKGGWYQKPPHKVIETPWQNEVSSTRVRTMLKNNDPEVSKFVPKLVLEYIEEFQLYKGDT